MVSGSSNKEDGHELASVSVCFPAYNEEDSIGDVLLEAHELLSQSGIDYEILVCNDGSDDATGKIIGNLSGRISRLRTLEHKHNRGIRATFEHLYREASKDFVFLNSTDRQWKTAILFDMLRLASEFDIIIASRKQKHYGVVRGFVSGAFNLIPLVMFGVRTHDAGAVKLVRREIIERFSLISRSPFSEAERLIRASRAGYRIKEFPVDIEARQSGRGRGLSPALLGEAFLDVVRLWWSLRKS